MFWPSVSRRPSSTRSPDILSPATGGEYRFTAFGPAFVGPLLKSARKKGVIPRLQTQVTRLLGGFGQMRGGMRLAEFSSTMHDYWRRWQEDYTVALPPFKVESTQRLLRVRLVRIGSGLHGGTLIYLEEMAARRIPRATHFPGYAIVAPDLLAYRDDAQPALAPAAIRRSTIW